MTNVVSIKGGPPPSGPDEGVIAELESILEEARKGRVIAFAYAVEHDDGFVDSGWNRGQRGNNFTLLAGLTLASNRLARSMTDDSRHEHD